MHKRALRTKLCTAYVLVAVLVEIALLQIFATHFRFARSLHTLYAAEAATRPDGAPLHFYLDNPQSIDACAIPDACVRATKQHHELSVPNLYQQSAAHLHRCLPPNVHLNFYDPAAPPAALDRALRDKQNFDVMGLQIEDSYFTHFPHFAREFLEHIAVPAALFLGRHLAHPHCTPSPGGALVPCMPTQKHRRLDPRFALSERVLGGSASSWKRGFVALATNSTTSNLRHVHLFKHSMSLFGPGPRCYRSVLSSRLAFNAGSAKRDAMLRAAGVERQLYVRDSTKDACNPHILVVARDPNSDLDRTIPPASLRQLRKELRVQLDRAGLRGATLEFVTGLGSRPFLEQVAITQRADVLVTVHGAELTNGLFFRRGVSVVEVFPFGYHLPWFDSFFVALGAKHVPVFAPPDFQRFSWCIHRRAVFRLPHMWVLWGRRVLRAFEAKAHEYHSGRAKADKDRAGNYSSDYYLGRYCARTQRIFIDPVELASISVREAKALCKQRDSIPTSIYGNELS